MLAEANDTLSFFSKTNSVFLFQNISRCFCRSRWHQSPQRCKLRLVKLFVIKKHFDNNIFCYKRFSRVISMLRTHRDQRGVNQRVLVKIVHRSKHTLHKHLTGIVNKETNPVTNLGRPTHTFSWRNQREENGDYITLTVDLFGQRHCWPRSWDSFTAV